MASASTMISVKGFTMWTSSTSPGPRRNVSRVRRRRDRYRGLFRVNEAIYTEHCEPNTVIMHPLPRDSRAQAQELDEDLNANPNLAIFRQTDNGVVVRMALFAMILDVVDQVHDHARPVTWYTAKRTPTGRGTR